MSFLLDTNILSVHLRRASRNVISTRPAEVAEIEGRTPLLRADARRHVAGARAVHPRSAFGRTLRDQVG